MAEKFYIGRCGKRLILDLLDYKITLKDLLEGKSTSTTTPLPSP